MIKKLLRFFLIIFIGLPASIFVKILNPIVCIRFGQLHASRIGHLALDFGIYLSKKSNQKEKTFDIFSIPKPICNNYFLSFIKRYILVLRGLSVIIDALKLLPNSSKNIITPDLEISQSFDKDRWLRKSRINFKFKQKEDSIGDNFLKSIGCHDKSKLVCMNIRDTAYLTKTYSSTNNTEYHSYRDSDIEDYIDGVMLLIERGYFVIRTGKYVNKELNINDSNFLDYPNSGLRTDFLDIWLMANCKFCISSSNGLECISDIFGVPMLFINAAPIGHINSWSNDSIWTPKIIVDKNTKRIISLKEQIEKKLVDLSECDRLKVSYNEFLESMNLEIIDNSKDLIRESFNEFLDKIEGKWQQKNDSIKQLLFWETLSSWVDFNRYHNDNYNHIHCSLSDTFILNHGEEFLKNE